MGNPKRPSSETKPDTEAVREFIQHEDNLINHRLTWFITLQGLLFAGLGFAWDKKDARDLVFVFCGLGILAAVSAASSLWAGAAVIERLSKKNPERIGRCASWAEKIWYPWFALPVLFVIAWALTLWLNWQRPA